MNWRVAITTAPRSTSYLSNTIEQIERAGWDEYAVASDDECKLGPWKNFHEALSLCVGGSVSFLDQHSILTACVIFQDDIEITDGLRAFLDRDEVVRRIIEAGNVLSLYTATPHHVDRECWHRLHDEELPRKCYGALGVMMSSTTARELLNDKEIGKNCRNKTDFWIGKFCQVHKREYWMHSPSFVRHVGEVSSLEHNQGGVPDSLSEFRQCKQFLKEIK